LESNPTEEADENQGNEEKKKYRRRIKKGSRQKILQAASAMSPGKLRSAITNSFSTSISDGPSPDKRDEKALDFRASIAMRINTITKGSDTAEDPVHSSYQQLDDGDDASVFSTHDEPVEPSPKQNPFEPESDPNGSFTHVLVAAAPVQFFIR
jgi:hypothetical protein